MVEFKVTTEEIVSKIIVDSGIVYLYSYGTLIAQVLPTQIINKARPSTELYDLVNVKRQDLYIIGKRFLN